MAGKWGSFRGSVDRLHSDFGFPTCTFENYVETGIDRGQPTGEWYHIGTIDCEFVPPGADSTVDTEGTHLDFSTSIRAPTEDITGLLPDTTLKTDTTVAAGETASYGDLTIASGVTLTVNGTLIANQINNQGTLDNNGTVVNIADLEGEQRPYGVDGKRPTRVTAEGTTYEVQSVVPEHGSDMRLLRLTEV